MGATAGQIVGRAMAQTPAEASRSASDNVFTADQATRGQTQYRQHCASCHGDRLEGGAEVPGPPLAGDVFMETWHGQTVGDLFDRLRQTMPLDKPGSLGRSDYADIVAFILSENQFPAGSRELASDTSALKAIRIEHRGSAK